MEKLRALRDLPVRQPNQFVAAAAHLDIHVAQTVAQESETWGLSVNRTAQIANLAGRVFLKCFHLFGIQRHKIILASICFMLIAVQSATLEL